MSDSPKIPPIEETLPALMKSKQTAQLCEIGERTLWRWSRSGIAPAPVLIGGGTRPAVRYRRDEYLDWIEAGCPRVGGAQ